MKINKKDIIVVGFALFAMFFGAGNLIFPPLLGLESGSNWTISSLGFIITGVGMTLLGVVATARAGGSINDITYKIGKVPGTIIGILVVLSIGPLLAIPRTAATTHEIVFYGNNFSPIISAIVFFAVVLFFTLRPSKIIDSIGKVLTPALLIVLFLMIVKGIINPIGEVSQSTKSAADLFSFGFTEGYQTMDTLAAVIFTGLIINSIKNKGYTKKDEIVKVTILSGVIAAVGLALVYFGLSYLGAIFPAETGLEYERVSLLVQITKKLFGNLGHIILALAIALACLTTAIGLTSSVADYFSNLSNNKISYNALSIAIAVFSGFFAIRGVDSIISISYPLLVILYPIIIVLIVLNLFEDKIKYKSVYVGGVLGAFIVSLVLGISQAGPLLGLFGIEKDLTYVSDTLSFLPLSEFGLEWIIPAVICTLIGFIIGPILEKKK